MRVAFAPNQIETAELLSKMTGSQTIQKATFNYSGSRLSPVMDHINATADQIERPLLTPDEVTRIKPPKKKGKGKDERIVEPGDMLIFVAGEYPIYGTQMLYFFDPVFLERASLPPPTKLASLKNGKTVGQPPVDATENVLSKPETPPETEAVAASSMEQAFHHAARKPVRAPLQKVNRGNVILQNGQCTPPPKQHPHIEAMLAQAGHGATDRSQVAPPKFERSS